jgi:predicted ATP-grasp superfamily ATP-dependent carboligase
MMQQPPAVLLGGMTNALSAARALGKMGVSVEAVGSSESPVRASRYCRRFTPMSSPHLADRLVDWLVAEAPRDAVLVPCDDDALDQLARRHGELVFAGLRPVPFNPGVTVALLDKARTYEIARASGVGAPRTATLDSVADLDRAVAEISMPCALKPLHIHEFARHFRRKVIVVQTFDELRAAFSRTSALGLDMLLTEIVPGPEEDYWSYYTYVDKNGVKRLEFTKRKMRQYPVGFGGATYHVAERSVAAMDAGRSFVEGAGVRGIACVEFKRDARDGQLKIMECNARLTAANELMRIAGLDLAGAAYRDAIGLPPPVADGFTEGTRLWYPIQDILAFRTMRESGQLTTRRWLSGLAHRQRFPVFSVTDPMPSLSALPRFPARVRSWVRRDADTSSSPYAAFF